MDFIEKLMFVIVIVGCFYLAYNNKSLTYKLEAEIRNHNHTQELLEWYEDKNELLISENNEVEWSLNDCVNNLGEYIGEPFFLGISREVANRHEYDYHEYNCVNYSYDLINEYKKHGVVAVAVSGYYYYINGTTCDGIGLTEFECGHMWVCLGTNGDSGLCIEAVTGELINPDYYRKYYVEVSKTKI